MGSAHAEIRTRAKVGDWMMRCGTMRPWGIQILTTLLSPSSPLGNGTASRETRFRPLCRSIQRLDRATASLSSSPRSASTATASPSPPKHVPVVGRQARTGRSGSLMGCWARSPHTTACCLESSSPTDAGVSPRPAGRRRTRLTSPSSCPAEARGAPAMPRHTGSCLPFHLSVICASTAPGPQQESRRPPLSFPQTDSATGLGACSNCGPSRDSRTSNRAPRRWRSHRMDGSSAVGCQPDSEPPRRCSGSGQSSGHGSCGAPRGTSWFGRQCGRGRPGVPR